jgi:hypothetical protein
MKISRPILVSALVIVLSASASLPANAQELNNTAVFGGTLNVVLANKNGAVILTESMLSDESDPVPVPHPEVPLARNFSNWTTRLFARLPVSCPCRGCSRSFPLASVPL